MLACRNSCSIAKIADARGAAFWASQHERAGSEQAVELYFAAAKMSYCEGAVGLPGDSAAELQAVYRKSLAGLIRTAQQFGRYDPVQGIRVQGSGEATVVPISYHGFNWGPRDFSRLVVADRFVRTELEANFYSEGVGLPLIVIREKETPERFHSARSHFAATANLKRNREASADSTLAWTLELADPFSVDCVDFNAQPVRLAADYSAPVRYTVGREKRTYLQDFLRPGVSTGEAKLILLEPYQPGKIPIVFIHGLLSDPMTWADLFETIHVDPELRDRYQFWAFRYATGEAFLEIGSHPSTGTGCRDDLRGPRRYRSRPVADRRHRPQHGRAVGRAPDHVFGRSTLAVLCQPPHGDPPDLATNACPIAGTVLLRTVSLTSGESSSSERLITGP
jgi:hypothetical protein